MSATISDCVPCDSVAGICTWVRHCWSKSKAFHDKAMNRYYDIEDAIFATLEERLQMKFSSCTRTVLALTPVLETIFLITNTFNLDRTSKERKFLAFLAGQAFVSYVAVACYSILELQRRVKDAEVPEAAQSIFACDVMAPGTYFPLIAMTVVVSLVLAKGYYAALASALPVIFLLVLASHYTVERAFRLALEMEEEDTQTEASEEENDEEGTQLIHMTTCKKRGSSLYEWELLWSSLKCAEEDNACLRDKIHKLEEAHCEAEKHRDAALEGAEIINKYDECLTKILSEHKTDMRLTRRIVGRQRTIIESKRRLVENLSNVVENQNDTIENLEVQIKGLVRDNLDGKAEGARLALERKKFQKRKEELINITNARYEKDIEKLSSALLEGERNRDAALEEHTKCIAELKDLLAVRENDMTALERELDTAKIKADISTANRNEDMQQHLQQLAKISKEREQERVAAQKGYESLEEHLTDVWSSAVYYSRHLESAEGKIRKLELRIAQLETEKNWSYVKHDEKNTFAYVCLGDKECRREDCFCKMVVGKDLPLEETGDNKADAEDLQNWHICIGPEGCTHEDCTCKIVSGNSPCEVQPDRSREADNRTLCDRWLGAAECKLSGCFCKQPVKEVPTVEENTGYDGTAERELERIDGYEREVGDMTFCSYPGLSDCPRWCLLPPEPFDANDVALPEIASDNAEDVEMISSPEVSICGDEVPELICHKESQEAVIDDDFVHVSDMSDDDEVLKY